MLKRKRDEQSSSGFTLVELIVVIVVLGILAAIGIPRYNNYVNESRLAHIKADMKTISGLIEVVAMDDDGVYRGGGNNGAELREAIAEGRAYKEGNPLLLETDIGGGLHIIKDPFVKSNARSKLKGTFLADENDEVYYVANKKLKGTSKDEGDNNDTGDTGEPEWDGYVAKDEDFEWKSNKNGYTAINESGKGYYHYVGAEKEVKIPHTINGNPMTSYYMMFNGTDTERVMSTNKNITDMGAMFLNNSATSLDLSQLNTSNVENMSVMFGAGRAETLNLVGWDTSKVKNMNSMFVDHYATSLDLSQLNTSSVEDMSFMFQCSQAETLNLLGWDTSSVTNMEYMFNVSKFISLDLSKLNTSNVKNMNSMFLGSSATTLNVTGWNTSNVTDMTEMFYDNQATVLDLSSWDTSNLTEKANMFWDSLVETAYARTQEDLDNLSNSTAFPLWSDFILGKP